MFDGVGYTVVHVFTMLVLVCFQVSSGGDDVDIAPTYKTHKRYNTFLPYLTAISSVISTGDPTFDKTMQLGAGSHAQVLLFSVSLSS